MSKVVAGEFTDATGSFKVDGDVTAGKLIPTGTSAAGNGMYLADTNTLAFSTDGAERMRITNAGVRGVRHSQYLHPFPATGNLSSGTFGPGHIQIGATAREVGWWVPTDFVSLVSLRIYITTAIGGGSWTYTVVTTCNGVFGVSPSSSGSATQTITETALSNGRINEYVITTLPTINPNHQFYLRITGTGTTSIPFFNGALVEWIN